LLPSNKYSSKKPVLGSMQNIRDICKVRKAQQHNLEFGHTQGEIKKKTAKKYISIQLGMKLRKPSILMVN